MLDKEMRNTIICLHNNGKSIRDIAKTLSKSRNTIRKVLSQGEDGAARKITSQNTQIIPILREVFARCLGNAVRVHEVLAQEYNIEIAYSSLTRLISEAQLRGAPKRFGEYVFEPGEEMQHDTSPHKILIGEKFFKAQCASLVLGYSRMLYAQYYTNFTRFEAKTFLKAAFEFAAGCCKRCVVDNTSVILASGSGSDAVFSAEMNTFAKMFGFEFMAHSINNPNRKGKVEKPFHYIEKNFLAGRTFRSWDDLNQQLHQWCKNYANQKEKRELGMSPEAAYVKEKPYLIPLPCVLPPIYEHYQRLVDTCGFVSLDTNRYSAPEELIGRTLDVYKHPEEVRLFYKHKEVAMHKRLAGSRREKSKISEHHVKKQQQKAETAFSEAEATLQSYHEILAPYISNLKKRVRSKGHALNRLLHFKRTYPQDAFIAAIKQAHHYGMFDLNRLEELIIKFVAGNYFNLHGD